ncbi:MAG: TolB-like protein [Enterobacterales bacterium]|jgi:TolB-like protein
MAEEILNVLVRVDGLKVTSRITAQLIDASNEQHLWSDTYD